MIFNIFRIRKALKQAIEYVNEVNQINTRLREIIEEQNVLIKSLQEMKSEKSEETTQ